MKTIKVTTVLIDPMTEEKLLDEGTPHCTTCSCSPSPGKPLTFKECLIRSIGVMPGDADSLKLFDLGTKKLMPFKGSKLEVEDAEFEMLDRVVKANPAGYRTFVYAQLLQIMADARGTEAVKEATK